MCDGALPRFRNQPLVVVGGGDSAVEEATYLAKYAEKVYLVHRRDELRASKIMQERAMNDEKIEIVWNHVVDEVLGNDQDGVTARAAEKYRRRFDAGTSDPRHVSRDRSHTEHRVSSKAKSR